ncbi:precorrin-4 C(11)-methyltransferase [Hydrogenophilus thiooxidans]|uniref:precorrin-4 C(11)-methyltransferase n=1 Tax=Hydrogenophilus thiooxidans TaxID=2820326 RepID=UPI001C2161C8
MSLPPLNPCPGTVWFVGAGPGDPELITVKGQRLLSEAGAVLYAGSLVDEAVARYAPQSAEIADSKGMTLEAIAEWLTTRAQRHATVVRLQTGDPTLYGALTEMARLLDLAGVPWRVVPGVSSAFAAAAAAGESLTLPEVTQTVILTRAEGRTPMPPRERLEALAAHQTTVCLFLSITLTREIERAFLAAGWAPESPVLVVHKASWPQERIVRTTLSELSTACRAAKIVSQAMIIVSPALGARQWDGAPRSKLYDPTFTHRFRRADKAPEKPNGGAS